MSSLAEVLAALAPDGDGGGWAIEAPEEWAQGRTLFGGITAAFAFTAVERSLGDLGPLRSAQFAFVGPAAGRVSFHPELLRRGRSSAIATADCRNAEGIAARATFVFGQDRESAIAHDVTPAMAVPPPDACEPFHRSSKPLPGFLARYDFRLAAGTRLFQPDARAEFAVWARLREGDGGHGIAALLAYADCLPGAALANAPRLAPISTMTWTVDLHQPLALRDGWHLVCSSSEVARDGYSLQPMRVYAEDGTPLVSARQTVAVFA